MRRSPTLNRLLAAMPAETYERLLERTTDPGQRNAVTTALGALRNWRF